MKVLFIGLGGIGQRHLRNLKAMLGSSLEVHAYRVRGLLQEVNDQLDVETQTDIETKYGVRVHHDLDSALAQKPTAVFVCNPSSMHIPVAMAAAEAGCHLFVEKPLSHNLAGVEALIQAVHRRGLVAMVGYQLRFHPCLQAVHRQIKQGLIGQPLSASAEVGEYLPDWHGYEDYRQMYASRSELGGGVLLSQIHEMDYLYWLFGLPRRIFTLGGHLSSLEIDVEDVACSVLDCEVNGRTMPILLHQDYLQRPPSRGCTIIGEKGKIVMNLSELRVDRYDSLGGLAKRQSFEGFERNELFAAELRHFLDCIEGRATPLTSLRDGAQSLRMALAAKESLETGQVVSLQSTPETDYSNDADRQRIRREVTIDFGLSGKRVLVTGSSRGIGLAIAEGFLRAGASVALVARSQAPLAEAAGKLSAVYGQGRVLPLIADCSDEENWQDALRQLHTAWGGLDVVIANIGDGRSVPDALPDSSRFAQTWNANFTTAEKTARATLPLLKESGGCMLFIASIAGLEFIEAPTDYSVAKTAMIALSKQLARKLAPQVRVNCIAPGNVYFPGGSWDAKIKADPKHVESLISATVPMRRFGTPTEIADAVVFLCSNRARFITGACLVVDGGQTVSLF